MVFAYLDLPRQPINVFKVNQKKYQNNFLRYCSLISFENVCNWVTFSMQETLIRCCKKRTITLSFNFYEVSSLANFLRNVLGQDAGGYSIKVDFITRKKYISFIFSSVFKSDMMHWAEIQGKLMLEFAFYKIFTQRFSITFTEKKNMRLSFP